MRAALSPNPVTPLSPPALLLFLLFVHLALSISVPLSPPADLPAFGLAQLLLCFLCYHVHNSPEMTLEMVQTALWRLAGGHCVVIIAQEETLKGPFFQLNSKELYMYDYVKGTHP